MRRNERENKNEGAPKREKSTEIQIICRECLTETLRSKKAKKESVKNEQIDISIHEEEGKLCTFSL